MEVRIFKMPNGDEIIGSSTGDGSNWYITKPRLVTMSMDQHGHPRLGLMPWVLLAPDEKFPVHTNNILTSVEANKEVTDLYLQQTTSLDLSTRLN